MTNKEIFALAADCARKLKAAGHTDHIPKAKQILYDTLSPILSNTIQPQKKEEVETLASTISDEELRARLKVHLVERLDNGVLQAAEIAQLKGVFGLVDAVQDVIIELIDYRNMCSDCPKLATDKPLEGSDPG